MIEILNLKDNRIFKHVFLLTLFAVGYLTSQLNDISINKIIMQNLRTGEFFEYELGSYHLPIKSKVMEAVESAGLMLGDYEVDDLTLHQVFGNLSWQGVICRDATDGEGNSTNGRGSAESVWQDPEVDYANPVGIVWTDANAPVSVSDIIFDREYQVSLSKFRNFLYKKKDRRGISNVMQDKTISGTIEAIHQFQGNQFVLKLSGSELTFIVEPSSAWDTNLGAIITSVKGQRIELIYGFQENSTTVPVKKVKIGN